MPTILLQPDPATGEDTRILIDEPDVNLGTDALLSTGMYEYRGIFIGRTLLRFTLPDLPPNAVLSSVILTLYTKITSINYAQTAYAYRCPTEWTELGATWDTYDGTNAWPINGTGGDWDESLVATALKPFGEDLAINVTNLAVDAWENRSGVLSMLLKTEELTSDEAVFYSSDEETEVTKRPMLKIKYSFGENHSLHANPMRKSNLRTLMQVLM